MKTKPQPTLAVPTPTSPWPVVLWSLSLLICPLLAGAANVDAVAALQRPPSAIVQDPCWAVDGDSDGVPDCVEIKEGLNPSLRDNNGFAATAQGVRLFTMQQFRDVLQREPYQPALDYWIGQISSGSKTKPQVLEAFYNASLSKNNLQPVGRLLLTLFGQFPSVNGYRYWAKEVAYGNLTVDQVAEALVGSNAFKQAYGSLSNSEYIQKLYFNALGRLPTPTELDGWLGQLAFGLTRGGLALQIANEPTVSARLSDRLFISTMFVDLARALPSDSAMSYWLGRLAQEPVAGRQELIRAYLGELLPNYAKAAQTYRDRLVSSCVADVLPPLVPLGLRVDEVTRNSIRFSWNPSTDQGCGQVMGYKIFRNGFLLGSVSGNNTSYTNTGLVADTTYCYTVSAIDSASNDSGASLPLCVKTLPNVDDLPPDTPQFVPPVVESTQVRLNWNAVQDHGGGQVAGYHLFRNGVLLKTLPADQLSVVDTSVQPQTSYRYQISAFDNAQPTANESTPSPELLLTTPPQTQTATVYYSTGSNGWRNAYLHYALNGNWNGEPGDRMDLACLGWRKQTVTLPVGVSNITAAFTNGYGFWDNQQGSNYVLPAGVSTVKDGVLSTQTSNPCANQNGLSMPARLGVQYSAQESVFSLWSPDSSNVQLSLNGQTLNMTKLADAQGYSNVYAVKVPGDHKLKPYHFLVNGKNVRDPYAVMVEPGTNNGIVMDLAATDPASGWAPVPPLPQREDAVIYEVHVRDFTIHPSSGVDAAKRGRFAGMVQAGTTFNGEKTGIDHLVDLGVTHVQILPFYDYSSCPTVNGVINDQCYNWGYDPLNYNVPEERYSSDPLNYPQRVQELKAMINAFHQRGIRVIMDVVYNHSSNRSMLGDITGRYFTAQNLWEGCNSSPCPASTTLNSGEAMVSRFIRDSLEHWVQEYQVDGFRFDLMGIFHTEQVKNWADYLNSTYPSRKLVIYGEPWNGGVADADEANKIRLGTVGTIAGSHVGVFNDQFRKALKGGCGDDSVCGGFAMNEGSVWANNVLWGSNGSLLSPMSVAMLGSPRYDKLTGSVGTWDPMFTLDPEQTINYVDAHDNLCLNDKVEQWASNKAWVTTGYKQRIQEYALSNVLLAQGLPFLHGGSEILRTKQGDHNSYQSPDSVNQYDWSWKPSHKPTYNYIKKLIALRKNHPAFRMTTRDEVFKNVKSNQVSSSLVVTEINGAAKGDAWSKVLVIANSAGDLNYSLPAGQWKVALENSDATAGNDRVVTGSVVAKGTSVTVLYQ